MTQRVARTVSMSRWIAVAGLLCGLVLQPRWSPGDDALLLAQFGGQVLQMEESQIISWAFENQSSLESAKQHATDQLEGQIDFVAVIGTVTPDQRRRLALAGQGDISRFFVQAEAVIARQPRGNLNQEEWNKVWQEISPIREQFAQGLTGDGSLFQKTIRSALSVEQCQSYDELIAERDGRNYRALVAATIAELEIKIPLTRDQRVRLTEVVVAKTKPPTIKLNNYLQYLFVMYRMSKMNDGDLKPIFDDAELKTLKQILRQAEGYAAQFERQQPAGRGLLNWLF